jgi:hypothetical protein
MMRSLPDPPGVPEAVDLGAVAATASMVPRSRAMHDVRART